MNSPQDEDVVTQMLDAFQNRDLDRFLDLLHPEVEAVPIVGSELDGTVYKGHEGVRDWWDQFFSVFRGFEVEVDEVRVLGDQVIASSRFRSGSEEGGVKPELVVWTLSELRDGKVISWRSFRSEAEALEAAA